MRHADQKLVYGLEPVIAVVALGVATLDALIVPLVLVPGVIAKSLLPQLAIASAVVAAVVFLRLLISPKFHYAMRQANELMTGGQMFRWKPVGLGNADWGLTGSKWGRGYIVPLRLILMAEFLVVFFVGPTDRQWLALLVFSGTALTILLTQSQLINHFPRPSEAA